MNRLRRPRIKELLCDFLTMGLDGLIQKMDLHQCNEKSVHILLLKELKERNVAPATYENYDAWIIEKFGHYSIPGEGKRKPKIGDLPFRARVVKYNSGVMVRLMLDEYGLQEHDEVEISLLPEGIVVKPVGAVDPAESETTDEEPNQ